MPYISQSLKDLIELGQPIHTAGELNYILTRIIRNYWINSAENYQVINDIIGALEGSKAEFQRRVVIPYEEKKIQENGDVY